jgi:DHA1 family bicyclomycin/chloramphenicol resistance-like MFS transporter
VLTGLAAFAFASVGCALSQHIGALVFFRAVQGMSAGAGIVISRAVIRDMFPPADAQRVMSQVTIYFGVAPALAPIVGGFLFIHVGWHAIFWFLAAVSVILFVANWKLLPETLHATHKQAFNVRNLLHGYWALGSNPRFITLALASGIPFNGMFLYVLSAPVFLGEHLRMGPGEFFWLFVLSIAGIVSGAYLSGRMAGRVKATRQIRYGFMIMATVSVANLALNLLFTPQAWWALLPIALYSFGWAMMVPVVTLMVLDLLPERRGMASSFQACIGSAANGLVAGVIAPLVMHSTVALATASLAMMSVGVVSWLWVRPRLARTGAAYAAGP